MESPRKNTTWFGDIGSGNLVHSFIVLTNPFIEFVVAWLTYANAGHKWSKIVLDQVVMLLIATIVAIFVYMQTSSSRPSI